MASTTQHDSNTTLNAKRAVATVTNAALRSLANRSQCGRDRRPKRPTQALQQYCAVRYTADAPDCEAMLAALDRDNDLRHEILIRRWRCGAP